MKKLFLLAACACCSAVMTAQNPKGKFSIKPMAGINVTNVSGGLGSDLFHNRVRFTGGLEVEYGVNQWLGISIGAIYSQQGTKVDGTFKSVYDNGTTTAMTISRLEGNLNSEYINIPLLANIYIPWVKGLSVKTGIQLGHLIGSEVEENYLIVTDSYTQPNGFQTGLPTYTGDSDSPSFINGFVRQSDVCKSVDFGIPFGLSYEYKNFVLDARYYLGLTKIDNTQDPDDSRNRYFSFTLGYRFHL
ncbi:MAG: PorT family protein [Prevotella sp.]|nr:PorT family protein [Prevotella sp.]